MRNYQYIRRDSEQSLFANINDEEFLPEINGYGGQNFMPSGPGIT
jgi:hypothetical protein